jgi:hypothetical protein
MAMHDDEVKRAGDLRRMAEAELERNPHLSAPADAAMAPEDIMRLLHELSVQQIELEMQREEMRREELWRAMSISMIQPRWATAPLTTG